VFVLEETPVTAAICLLCYATLVVQPNSSQERRIENLDFDIIEKWCPSLATRFHAQAGSLSKVFVLQETPVTAAICLLRYLYLGEYTFYQADVDVVVPPLLRLQLFLLATQWNLPDLQTLILIHITEDTDPTWGQGYHPMDLCEAIRTPKGQNQIPYRQCPFERPSKYKYI